MSRQLRLLAVGNVTRTFVSSWRMPGVRADLQGLRDMLINTAHVAEAARLDGVFLSDAMNYGAKLSWPFKVTDDFEPFTAAAALAAVTERLGLVVTGSTSYQAPYHLARQTLSLDHLSAGRAGWNLVTSWATAAAENFGAGGLLDHDERYDRAEEALDVVKKLWDGWEESAVIRDLDSGVYNDPERIHTASHRGRYFQVEGPLGSARSAQGQPVIFQAGSSARGMRFAVRHAEVIFVGKSRLEQAQQFYADIHRESLAAGVSRPPLITPQFSFLIGSTEEEAQRIEDSMRQHFVPEHQIGVLQQSGIDLANSPLDGPLPPFPESTEGNRGALAGFRSIAASEQLTVREFLYRTSAGFGFRFVGSAERAADELQRWFENGAADGFVLAPILPNQLEVFCEQVLPILRRRGLFRHEYAGTTFREHLGLARPLNRYSGVGD